ncbi:hydrolase YafV [Filimonas sp.]|nr:hydrolase YafV [Filimonas sp.]
MSTLSFTLIQSHLHWEDRTANLAMFEKKIKALGGPLEIVVLPEMFNTGFSMKPGTLSEEMEGETVRWMKKIAAEKRIILTGSMIIRENEKYYNRLIWMQPDGQMGSYDKRHLFSYGGEDKEFTPGTKRFIAQVKGWKICTMICYDLRFPVWNRLSKEDEYDVLLFVANWPAKRITAWKSLLRARAIENQCYVVAINRTGEDGSGLTYSGESCVIDPLGEILYAKPDEEDIYTIELSKALLTETRNNFPFHKDKDDYLIL